MDETQYLILTLYRDKWVDKTKSVQSFEPYSNGFKVNFEKKTYSYGYKKIRIYKEPETIDHDKYSVFINNYPVSKNAVNILKFSEHICIFEDGRKRLYPLDVVTIVKNIAHSDKALGIIDYFSSIANLKKEQSGSQHLNYYYTKRLGVISDESIAARFIDGVTPIEFSNTEPLIFPFGVNLSQREALNKALQHQLSLIQGPPGTGKTQTILNLIANLIIQGKSIAVAAGNNSAVENIYEKLEKSQLGFLAATLGKNDNVKIFFENLPERPDMSDWVLSKHQQDELRLKLAELDALISRCLESKNILAREVSYLDKLKLEARYFQKSFDVNPLGMEKLSLFKNWQAPEILNFMADFEYHSQLEGLSWQTKLKWLFKYRIYKFDTLSDDDKSTFKRIVSEFYQVKTLETEAAIATLQQQLESADFTALLSQQSDYSMRLFKSFIAGKYKDTEFKSLDSKNYNKQAYDEFVAQFPVTLSTTDSLLANKPASALFDYLIVDEASQVNLVSGFLAMCCSKNLVVVGDSKQLPHIANDELPVDIEHQYGAESPYDFKRNSLLVSLNRLFSSSPTTLLKEHYRCHPRIIDFCNQKYYGGELIVMTDAKSEPFKVVQTEKGNHGARPASGKGMVNQREIDVVEREVLPEELSFADGRDIGVVTPYRAQANKFGSTMNGTGIEVDTVHKFQGREKETIIFSTTANKINRHIDQSELINVTVSRAKNRLVFVSSENLMKEEGTNIGDLMRYIEYQSEAKAIVESSVISIFDCLYGEYSEKLNKFMSKVKRSSDYLSEELMSALIDELLISGDYLSLAYKKNYPLNLLIQSSNKFTDREARFIDHPSSHVDFVLYNVMDMLPVLAIEVDGYEYHDLNPLQLDRDSVKDSIFKKVGLPLARFSTKGSSERERLAELLSPWKERYV